MTAPNTLPRSSPTQRRWATEQRRVQIYNTTSERIPPFSCCQIVSSIKEGSKIAATDDKYFAAFAERGQPVFLVKKPNGKAAENDPSRYVFTCEASVAPNSFGSATADFPLVAASLCINVVNHKSVGPKSGQWYLGKGKHWKLVSHDPTHAVDEKTEEGKALHSVIIAPHYFLKVETSKFAKFFSGGGPDAILSTTELYGVPTEPGEFAVPSYDQFTEIEIAIAGQYSVAMFSRLWIRTEGSDAPPWPIEIEVVRYKANQTLDPTAGEVVLTLSLAEADATDNVATTSHYWTGNAIGSVEFDFDVGDILKVRNASSIAVRIGGWPTIRDGYDGWVGNPPYWYFGWASWNYGWPGFWGGYTGWNYGWGNWGFGFASASELRVQLVESSGDGDAEGHDEATCMADLLGDTRVIDIPPPEEDDEGDPPVEPPGGPPGGGTPPGTGFPPPPDGGGEEIP